MQRIKALGGGIAIQHRMAYQGESFIRRYGKKAALNSPPVKRMLELGIPVGLGTDGTRVASYNPWMSLYWIVSGKSLGGNQVMAKENTLDRQTALQLYTAGGYDLIKEKQKGKIASGYLADLVVLSDDYFNIEEEKIKEITSELTILDGKVVYGKGDFKAIAPQPLDVIPSWSPVKYYGGYQTK
jgi:predicted amidohydrolase YtcJ